MKIKFAFHLNFVELFVLAPHKVSVYYDNKVKLPI